ncbi:hypothetical protein [Pedobacter metabolipauper]|uniref:Uncharacterized protein n=1 Tax=Pedobacter metabolipauper TaxID=425513 RepID=A0A4V3D0P7_9SPHI|nr:hypothetical protein [Pedobacter metabolipauper]TDQ06858.1 hypothetical protein ATK78_3870 [Pedobacter metabolipauper]
MKKTILALAFVATTFGAFAQTPSTPQKPAVHKTKSHKKTAEKKVVPVVTTKTVEKKKSGK